MTELKTLKDMKFTLSNLKLGTKDKLFQNYEADGSAVFINPKELKAEAVKWVKEDIEEFGLFKNAISLQTRKWMKRLNITEEDLK